MSEKKMDQLRCFLDGDMLAIVKDDFINLQESEVIWISLSGKECIDIERMMIENRKQKPPKPLPVQLISMDGSLKPPRRAPIEYPPMKDYTPRRGHPDDLPDLTSKTRFIGMGDKERKLFLAIWLIVGLVFGIYILSLIFRIL